MYMLQHAAKHAATSDSTERVSAVHNKRMQAGDAGASASPVNTWTAHARPKAETRPVDATRMRVRFVDVPVLEAAQSVWLLNDSKNKKERVSAVLESVAGLTSSEAETAMMQAHTKGAGLVANLPKAEAQSLLAKVVPRPPVAPMPLLVSPASSSPLSARVPFPPCLPPCPVRLSSPFPACSLVHAYVRARALTCRHARAYTHTCTHT